ncbi:uncharacterized protein Dana_GF18542, isoform D [Drosophila ananassae]|uniref:Uncharacterized protein, isoform D n=1 Tax=Drosophila ananassae TaxID=7217 RepID=A0A0P9A0R0_DROAN|nr:uncharacterized protein LOC6501315 isoform X2 [Drosophila ananassae]KPU80301.1 uncharacterized protein Dana_GF18542, isoform D [Drosophila ananassae]
MAPALTAEPLSPKEKLTSTASPSASIRSSSSSGGDGGGSGGGIGAGLAKKPSTPTPATATTRVTRSASAAQQRSPLVNNNNNNKRKSNNSIKPTSNDTMGLSTAPNPHSSSSTVAAAAEPVVVASTSESSNSAANSSTTSSPLKDNSTAQLLADLTINFEETLSAEICLRKTLPEVSLGKEPATSAAVTGAGPKSAVEVAVAGQLLIPATEELPKIETDNLEERLSQLDGNASGIPEEQLAAQLPPPPAIAQQEPPAAPSTPSRPQQPVHPQLESPQQARHQQMTPQSTTSSINFLKDGAAGEVLEDQDIEEVLKALKTFDGEFFSDVWEEAAPAAPIATAAPANLPELAEDTKPSISSASVVTPAKPERPWQESHAELEQQQHVLNRRIEFMLRRMRKYQARQMCRHTSDEVAGIFEWSARSSHKTPNPVRSSTLTEQEATVQSIVSGRPGSSFWEEQKKHPLPASQMSSLIRHIATAAKHQQICNSASGSSATLAPSSSWYNSSNSTTILGKRPRKNQLEATAAATAPGGTTAASGSVGDVNAPRADDIVPNYDTYVTSELTHVAGLLHTELREVQNAIDSDATESSSGGESADEMVTYNNTQQRSLSISRRAVWRYSRDRAAIALRWSWLCAQLTDLEMKIRQHSDLYLELTQTKGQVQLLPTGKSEVDPPEPANHQGDRAAEEAAPTDWLCSRARPLVLSEFRKRKLFQTTNMHTISKKAARPSNIKCGCQWPQVPCTLCTGRADPTAPRELAETMMPATRVALLDAGYHPVLSFASDVSQSVHLEAIARQPDWQYRVMRSQAKAIAKSVWKAEREALASGGGTGGHTGSRRSGDGVKRRYIRRKERNNNSNKDAGSGSAAAGAGAGAGTGGAAVGVGVSGGGGDSGNGTAGKRQQSHNQNQNPTGTNSSSSPWTDSRQRPRPRHHSPSSTSISASISGAKKSRKSTNTNSSSISTSTQHHHTTNHHLNGYGDRFGDHQSNSSRSRRNSSPSHGHRIERTSDRRIRPVYDIDNIVIPYSMAAQTRVEILPYKEIPTPKWRIVDSDGDKAKQSTQTDESPAESKLSNGQTTGDQAPQPPEQPPKVNGLRQKQKQEAVRHNNNNNNTNVNNNKNGLVNGNAGTGKEEAKVEEKTMPEKSDEKTPAEEPAKKPKLNGKITKTPSAKAGETSPAAPEPPLPKRPKLEKANGQVVDTPGQKAADKPEEANTEEKEREAEVEDLSDEAFIARHHLAMLEERRRYETFLKFPWTPRPRANRRIDSRAESSGANTPDPASPAPVGAGAMDNESIPSPLAHPLEGFNESGELIGTGQSRPNRRRTTSSKLKEQAERRSTTPDLREAYALMPPSPFEPLHFPLSEEVYQRMLAETYATPRYLNVSKRAKSKSISSNCDGSSSQGAGSKGSRRSSKTKTKLNGQLNGQLNGHPAAAKTNGLGGGGGGKEGEISEPEEEDMLLEEEDDDYPKHYLVPLDDEQQSAPDAEQDVYDEAIKAYLGDQEGIDEDLGNDPFEDDDPNDPEWRNRTDGVRSRRV